MKYYVFRIYTIMNGEKIEDKNATYVFTDRTAAMKQYYKFLATDIDDATKLTVLCCVMDDEGKVLARQKFEHAAEAEEQTAE